MVLKVILNVYNSIVYNSRKVLFFSFIGKVKGSSLIVIKSSFTFLIHTSIFIQNNVIFQNSVGTIYSYLVDLQKIGFIPSSKKLLR